MIYCYSWNFEPVSANNYKEDGYYIVNFTSDPYTIQEGLIIGGRKNIMGEQSDIAFYLSRMR